MLKLLMQFRELSKFLEMGYYQVEVFLKQVPQFLNNFIDCTGFQQTMRFKGRMLLLPTASESKKLKKS